MEKRKQRPPHHYKTQAFKRIHHWGLIYVVCWEIYPRPLRCNGQELSTRIAHDRFEATTNRSRTRRDEAWESIGLQAKDTVTLIRLLSYTHYHSPPPPHHHRASKLTSSILLRPQLLLLYFTRSQTTATTLIYSRTPPPSPALYPFPPPTRLSGTRPSLSNPRRLLPFPPPPAIFPES